MAGMLGGLIPAFSGLESLAVLADQLTYNHNDPVNSWQALGTEAQPIFSAAGTSRPLWKTTDPLGLGAPYFDGVDDELVASVDSLDMSGGLTIFAVVTWDVIGANDGYIRMNESGGGSVAEIYTVSNLIVPAGNRHSGVFAFTSNSAPFGAGVDLITTCRFDKDISPDERAIRHNGANAAAVSTSGTGDPMQPENAITEIKLGHGNGSGKFNGWLYAVACYYGRQMTDAEVAEVEDSLNSRFGVY